MSPEKPKKKAFKMKLGDIASTNEANFIEEVKSLKVVRVVDVIKSSVSLKADISGIQGKRFLSVQAKRPKPYRIGFDMFAKAVLAVNPPNTPLVDLEYELKDESLLSKFENFGSPINDAFNRQLLKIKEAEKAQKAEK